MASIKIIKVEDLSTGSRLKELIQSRSDSQKDFIRKFNQWLQEQHADHPRITEKDISRWVNGKVKPRKDKLLLFSEYFGVDVGYLECTSSIRKKRRISQDDFKKFHPTVDDQQLSERLKQIMLYDRFQSYCESLGFHFEQEATASQEVTNQHDFTYNGKRYVVELTEDEGTDPEWIITFPDGKKIIRTPEQFAELVQSCGNIIEYEFSKIRKEGN